MSVDIKYFEDKLEEVKSKITKDTGITLDHIALEVQGEKDFLHYAKENPLHQQLIKKGIIKNFEEEYPGFMVVYIYNKNPVRVMLGQKLLLTVCVEHAQKIVNKLKLPQNMLDNYVGHMFAHEICHIEQSKLEALYPEKLYNAEMTAKGNTQVKNELFAEYFADEFSDSEMRMNAEKLMWSIIEKRINSMPRGVR